jgi:DNA-binding protein HU-beta
MLMLSYIVSAACEAPAVMPLVIGSFNRQRLHVKALLIQDRRGYLGSKFMKEEELINALSERTSVPKELADRMINTLVDIIIETVSDGKKVKIDKFGIFERRSRSERQGRNPKTGEILIIPATHAVAFLSAEPFDKKLNSSGQ